MQSVIIASCKSAAANRALEVSRTFINESRIGAKDGDISGMSVWGDSSLRFPPEIYKIIRHEKNMIQILVNIEILRFYVRSSVQCISFKIPVRSYADTDIIPATDG